MNMTSCPGLGDEGVSVKSAERDDGAVVILTNLIVAGIVASFA